MIANPDFQQQPGFFWAYVRTLSQQLGYTVRKKGIVKIPSLSEMQKGLVDLGLDPKKVVDDFQNPTPLGKNLYTYFHYRSKVLNDFVQYQLMDVERAREVFERLHKSKIHDCPIPMNKQKGIKATPSYFTGIINMLIADGLKGADCDYSPMKLTTVTRDGVAVRTLSRRIDGAFPSVVNPVVVWEIKEYYYTTTFGSRIADGVYETLLDGMELDDLRNSEGIDIKHCLMVDAYNTWWNMGKSYLCRMIDMLHMGYVDEILFGQEVVDRVPELVQDWLELLKRRSY